jgi:thiol:disulfide interchange protein
MRLLGTAEAVALLLCLLLLPASMAQDRDTSKHVPGLDMTKVTLNSTLNAMPADAKVLMEFYATWCPACRCVAHVAASSSTATTGTVLNHSHSNNSCSNSSKASNL